MKTKTATDGLHTAADDMAQTAGRLRQIASDLVHRADDDSEDEGRKARMAADALGAVSDSLETVAESARASGLALRDRGRDAARALERGEKVLRTSGFPGAAAEMALLARRNAGKIALAASAGTLALVALRQARRNGS